MTELISGKEALSALLDGKDVQMLYDGENWDVIENWQSWDVKTFLTNDSYGYKFRLKPRTITINGIEVPAPFEPKDGDKFWIISDDYQLGYTSSTLIGGYVIGVWRTEEEIKQVVAALREVFK